MNSTLPKISIVTCSYQQANFIDATIRSVLEQDYPALEYIVMDGGSTDGTVDILQRHNDQIDYWVSQPDDGQTDALNKGFMHSSGGIMGWLCSDDLLLPGALHTVATFFEAHPDVEAVYGDALWIDRSGQLIRQKREIPFSRFLLRYDHNYVPQPSMFWRRSLFNRVGGLDPRFDLAMDADLWDRFSKATRIAHIPVLLSCMRYYPEQKTRALHTTGRTEHTEIQSRSRLSHFAPLRSVLQWLARGSRLFAKLATGRYALSVPGPILGALERFRIPDEARGG
jgi:glycosyltransferase involved in cell wall biosynthesis